MVQYSSTAAMRSKWATHTQRTVIKLGPCLSLTLTVQLFLVLIDVPLPSSNGVALASALPQQRTTTQRPCTGYLCEYMQLNNEIAAAQGDIEKLADITRRLQDLRNRNAEEQRRSQDLQSMREQAERRRIEERRRQEEERERERRRQEEERRSQENSRSRGRTWMFLGLSVSGVLLFIGCVWCAVQMCSDDSPTGTNVEGYQLKDGDGVGGDCGAGHTPGGFIFPPGPTTATYTFTPDGGQPCMFTPLGVGEPVQWAATPNPSPQFRPRDESNSTSNEAAAALPSPSAPPPEYHQAVSYPPYEEEEPDPKPGGRKKRIPGPT